jgi:hypothetical protein
MSSRSFAMGNRNFLDHYFLSVYNKLEADALLFNRELPHASLVGTENELALAQVLRQFLPPRFGIDSGIVVDRHGRESKQCDIVIFDAETFPRYLRKVFPIEVVYTVVEVKTNITSEEAHNAIDNLKSLFDLDFHPALTAYWQTRSAEHGLQADPPFGVVFGYRSQAKSFDTFCAWFPRNCVLEGSELRTEGQRYPDIRFLMVAALDQGLIKMESSNEYVQKFVCPVDLGSTNRTFTTRIAAQEIAVDPAKVLFIFLETLWQQLSQHHLHPGFDVRSYLSESMDSLIVL